MHKQMRADEIFHEFEDDLQPIKTRDAMNRKLAKKAAAGWGERSHQRASARALIAVRRSKLADVNQREVGTEYLNTCIETLNIVLDL